MTKTFRVVVETFDDEAPHEISRHIVEERAIKEVNHILDLGLRHNTQIKVLEKIQEFLLNAQSAYLKEDLKDCPRCGRKLRKDGYSESHFHAIFSDHKIKALKLRCIHCKWRSNPSVKSLFGTSVHPDLAKVQVECGTNHAFRVAQTNLDKQNCKTRKVNNHVAIKRIVTDIGKTIDKFNAMKPEKQKPAQELIIQIDGGHVKSNNKSNRSVEALTSVVYNHHDIHYNKQGERGIIKEKGCAVSALNDQQKTIKRNTLNVAIKAGLSKHTDVTAICDGASNCWSVVDNLKYHARSITTVLDWFHIAMKFQNVSLPKTDKALLVKVKWHLWRGHTQRAFKKFDKLIDSLTVEYKDKVKKLKSYIANNEKHLVNYFERKKQGLVISSSIIESNVQSIINKRCKENKQMSWSREGIHYVLQIRAAICSGVWKNNWENIVLNGLKTTNL